LPQLHKRNRWVTITRNIEVGALAILKDEQLPPLKWKLVRVTKLHPGSEVVRVVTVCNSDGRQFQRPTVKLALLPTTDDEETLVI